MAAAQLLRLLLTALGIYFIGFALPNLVFAAFLVAGLDEETADDSLTVWFSVVGPTISLAFGVGLIAFRDGLASRLEPGTSIQATSPSAGALHLVGISIVGAFFLVRGAADLGGAVVLALLYRSLPEVDASLSMALAQCFLGLAVFLGAPGLVGLWRALRSRGTPADD
jgi:hypothetical protein